MEHDTERRLYGKAREEQVEKLLVEVAAARKGLEKAKIRWYEAVIAAHNAGVTNGSIGGRADLTEAAVRLFLKRELKARREGRGK